VTITKVAAPRTRRLGHGSRSADPTVRLVDREVVEGTFPTLDFDIGVNVKLRQDFS
jgi:hypothetical protein